MNTQDGTINDIRQFLLPNKTSATATTTTTTTIKYLDMKIFICETITCRTMD